MTEYQIWLSTPFGTRVAVLPLERVSKLTYSRTTNAVGSLVIECARDAVPDSWVTEDARIEVWRKPDGGTWTLEGDGPWLLSKYSKGISKDGGRTWKLTAEPMLTLLKRRHVLYYANGTHALYSSTAAETLLKNLFYYNFLASASPFNTVGSVTTRDWATYLTMEDDGGLGPSITKQFAWRNVLPIMQEVCKDAAGVGTPLYFDIVQAGETFQFRVYVGQRGLDRSSDTSQLVISSERGSLGGDVESGMDWSESASVVLAGGQGQDAARLVAGVASASAVGRSPFGRREAWVDATQVTTLAGLATEAVQELRARRAKRTLKGDLLSVPGAVYGLDWGFGDRLIAEFESESYEATVDAVTVTLNGGKEEVKAAIKGEL